MKCEALLIGREFAGQACLLPVSDGLTALCWVHGQRYRAGGRIERSHQARLLNLEEQSPGLAELRCPAKQGALQCVLDIHHEQECNFKP
jgi:hypothetical protein